MNADQIIEAAGLLKELEFVKKKRQSLELASRVTVNFEVNGIITQSIPITLEQAKSLLEDDLISPIKRIKNRLEDLGYTDNEKK